MTAVADYVRMNLRVTPDAKAAWDAKAAEHGITTSALAEAVGVVMFENGKSLSAAVSEARRVTRLRRARSGQGSGQEPD